MVNVNVPSENQGVVGIDVSHFQGTVDWRQVAAGSVGFGFAKATDGTEFVDPMFARNRDGMRAAGIPCGAYHFFRASRDAASQARLFVDTASWQPGDLPPVLDVELTDGAAPPDLADGIRTWLETVREAVACTPIIYTARSFWDANLSTGFSGYPLWIAEYGVSRPVLPQGWNTWKFWQYSASGRVAGINGDVDLDRFAGSPSELKALTEP